MRKYFARELLELFTATDNGKDGLPGTLSVRRDPFIGSYTVRVNCNESITPTLLFHAGAGFRHYYKSDTILASTPAYDAAG